MHIWHQLRFTIQKRKNGQKVIVTSEVQIFVLGWWVKHVSTHFFFLFLGKPLFTPLSGATSFIDDNDAFIIGENYGSEYGTSIFRYTKSGQWVKEEKSLRVGRAYFSAVVAQEDLLGKCYGKQKHWWYNRFQ